MKHFVFPASPLNWRVIDEEFEEQSAALRAAGFQTRVLSIEGDVTRLSDILPEKAVTVWRGWMLSAREYAMYVSSVKMSGAEPLVSQEQYYAAHHLPNWYPLVESLTPSTLIFPGGDLQGWKLTVANTWSRIQVKDYVKSLKTKGGSVIGSAEELPQVLEYMQQYRGEIEGGVCLRHYEEFQPGSEKRYFVINKRFYGQEEAFDTRAMSILARVARDIPSPFFSVDIAQRTDGQCRIVEIGDGQVSDLVGWTPERFAEIWKRSES